MREAWIRGLARNPATPIDVLLRLIDAAPTPAVEGLRQFVASNPSTPPDVDDADLAEHAAANPALPPVRMQWCG
ncbi:hypothetical protein AB0M36_17140 [Actinoplanes sp. NPDC051346]|uniref:hypothetical protein n=1 Tax=Actinoplanes sp. NPDC051346 TaxID=3155048 RepID=UPI0034303830